MSQAGLPPPMRDKALICVSEYFLESRGIDIPKEWLEIDPDFPEEGKILRLLEGPRWAIKTKYHDIFYEKYFENHPDER